MQLYEQYRPKTLADIIGHTTAIKRLTAMTARESWDRDALWIQGPSGTGKTTIAEILANKVCDYPDMDIFHLDGDKCGKPEVNRIMQDFGIAAWGALGWKCCIINEAQCMTQGAKDAWLTALEPLPARRLFIFTSTTPLEPNSPLGSRCNIVDLHNDDATLNAYAAHLRGVAQMEELDGLPLAAYRQLIESCQGNVRTALQKIGFGEMLAA